MRCERGYTEQLPDLVGWLQPATRPIAVIAESGGRRQDRQKMILEGWRDAVLGGRYGGVRYDCANASVARWITRLAKKAGLTGPTSTAAVQPSAEEITVPAAAGNDAGQSTSEPQPFGATDRVDVQVQEASVRTLVPSEPVCAQPPEPLTGSKPNTPETTAARDKLLGELLGLEEAKPRRRWRR